MRNSPRVARIKVKGTMEKSSEEIGGKVSTPKPQMRINYSPFVATQRGVSFSKLTPLRMNNTHRITSRKTSYSKYQTGLKGTPTGISSIRFPAPQDLSFFLIQLLDFFHSADLLAEYFFYKRKSPLTQEDFLLSCTSLNIDKAFPDLKKIFSEMKSQKVLKKFPFTQKIIETQNKEIALYKDKDPVQSPSEKLNFSEILKKINPNKDKKQGQKISDIIQNAKGSDDLRAKLENQCSKAKLTNKEILFLLEYAAPRAKKGNRDLNLSVKLVSPYTNVPSFVKTGRNL